MDYTHPAGPYFWAHFDGSTGYYNSQSWQDGTYTPMDATLISDEKSYTHQPPYDPFYTLERATMHSMYSRDNTFEHGQIVRYVSPGATQTSSLSEASYSCDSVYSAETPNHPIRHSLSPVNLPTQHTLKLSDNLNVENMTWQSQGQEQVFQWPGQTVAPSVLPSQPLLPNGDEEPEHEDDKDMGYDFDDEIVATHIRSPIQMPQPEVLEVSELTAGSMTNSSRTYQAKKSLKEYRSEDDMDEEDETILIDADSDSDYQTKSRKRKSTRNSSTKNPRSPSQKWKSSKQSTQGNYRVRKRTNSTCKPIATAPQTYRPKSKPQTKRPVFPGSTNSTTPQPPSKADRTFPCTFHHFGCPAEFPNKNEWKRHVACQHLQLGYYRCDLDGCDPDNTNVPNKRSTSQTAAQKSKAENPDQAQENADQDQEIVVVYNDFNRKDLFTQHCRRMHGPTRNPALCSSTNKKGVCIATKEDEASFERQLDSIRRRCWNIRRKAPARSNCGFCDQVFDAAYYTTTGAYGSVSPNGEVEQGSEEKAWEERMEHVGRHYEKDANARKELEEPDDDLVKWGLATEVFHLLPDGRPWLVSAEAPLDSCEHGSGDAVEDEEKSRKARRQPSRTVVVKRREPVKEEADSDVDADGEDE